MVKWLWGVGIIEGLEQNEVPVTGSVCCSYCIRYVCLLTGKSTIGCRWVTEVNHCGAPSDSHVVNTLYLKNFFENIFY